MPATKTLYLIRHSKADFPSEGMSDLERSLTPQGIGDSHKVAIKLLAAGVKPDIIISSHAFRAVNTAILFATELGFPVTGILLNKKLYESTISDYLDVVNLIGDGIRIAVIFGHNETISEFAAYITGKVSDFPTTGVSEIRIHGEWSEVSRGNADLLRQFFT